jgi:membrane carboxypeptidase/penicillin-binding protein PbpC
MSRKLQEILLTWLIEKEIRKDKLIEIYLNIIEWGDGVYGIKEACDYYFQGLPPDQLTPSQAAFLASFIPYPRPFQKRFKKGMFGADRTKRWNRWWGRRQKLVHRIVRAMVNNCQKLGSKCPSQEQYCRIMELTCKDPGRELVEADNVKNLDDLFVTPEPIPLGDTLSPMEF